MAQVDELFSSTSVLQSEVGVLKKMDSLQIVLSHFFTMKRKRQKSVIMEVISLTAR
jgi:hypothetical protein